MLKLCLHAVALAVTIAALPLPALAAGWGAILGKGPVQDFNDEDIRLYLDSIRKALDATGGGQPVEWRNEASGAGGTLVVTGQAKVQGFAECRRVQSTVYSKKQKGVPSAWTACKDRTSGRWVLVGAG